MKQFLVLFASATGFVADYAQQLYEVIQSHTRQSNADVQLVPMDSIENMNQLFSEQSVDAHGKPYIYLSLVTSTTEGGKISEMGEDFYGIVEKHFSEGEMLSHLHFSVLGFGHSHYSDTYNQVGRTLAQWFRQMNAQEFVDCKMLDVANPSQMEDDFNQYARELINYISNT